MKIKVIEEPNNSVEVIQPIEKPKEIEMDFTLDNIELENSNLIRLEMNMIEFPLFTKNKKIKENTTMKYIFDKNKDKWMKVSPVLNSKIPSEFEEKILYAVMQLYRKNEYKQEVVTDFYSLIKEMNINYSGKSVKEVRDGIETISKTTYEFNNCFYDNHIAGTLTDKITTNIFTTRIIDLDEEKTVAPEYQKYFRNSKIKNLIIFTFSKDFYKNIIAKGFLRFDSKLLLQMEDSVARTIFIMITKWRNKKLYFKISSKEIAGKVPLAFEKKNISKTVSRISTAFEYLKNKELLNDYAFFKGKKMEESYYEIYFTSEHNFNYYTDTKAPNQEMFYINSVENDVFNDNISAFEAPAASAESNINQDDINYLFNLLPDEEKLAESKWKAEFSKHLTSFSLEEVEESLLMAMDKSKSSLAGYLDKCIKLGWAKGYKEQKLKKQAKKSSKQVAEDNDDLLLKQEMERKKELDAFYNTLDDFEKSKIYVMAIELMKENNVNVNIDTIVKSMYNTVFKYKALEKYKKSE